MRPDTPTTMRPASQMPPESTRRLEAIMEHLGGLLPGQAPLLEYVHHNTLHGLQHLPFAEALVAAEQIYGTFGYTPEPEFRRLYRAGRIRDEDLVAVLTEAADLAPERIVWPSALRIITRRDLYRIAMVFGIEPLTPEYLRWSIEELDALDCIQTDVPPIARHALLESIKHHGGTGLTTPDQGHVLRELWRACLTKLGLDESNLHPEELIDLSVQHAERLLAEFEPRETESAEAGPVARRLRTAQARQALADAFRRIGEDRSLRDLFLDLTGKDLLASVQPILIRYAGSFLDEGLAAWHPPGRCGGFYRTWRHSAPREWSPDPTVAALMTAILAELPEEPQETLIGELRWLGLAPERWEAYLTRVALELPGWSGMINWRGTHANYPANAQSPADLLDYLAVRLVLDRIWATRTCAEQWGIAADPPSLERYFTVHLSEFWVRRALFRDTLPEYLAAAAQRLVGESRKQRFAPEPWDHLADMIFTWQRGKRRNPAPTRHSAHGRAWQLFRLAQHLGVTAPDIAALPAAEAENLWTVLDSLTRERRAELWLAAYERHYREKIFHALAANHGHNNSPPPHERAEAQLIFCMDDREESMRRHLEEVNPQIETLGAAGFFGVAMQWRGLNDRTAAAHCPITIEPAHEVREVPASGREHAARRHRRQLRFSRFLVRLADQELRRNLVSSLPMIDLFAPVAGLCLVGKILNWLRPPQWVQSLAAVWTAPVETEVTLTAQEDDVLATSERPRVGFRNTEQVDQVAALLRAIGLTDGFAPLVVLVGHGSSSRNNPHLAAYACGACGGRNGGPNARVFAAMANRPTVRALLNRQGIVIPSDTWFLGAEHDTCDDKITWFDTQHLPPILRPALHKLKLNVDRARQLSAQERCRRFRSAPRSLSPAQALRHATIRARDFSQTRPELGHAANAAAFVGRRSISRGVFFDRRVFLISYDPTRDPSGATLAGILSAVAPVAAGINLEYYFSTVDNERFGCGTKVPHNVTGLYGVMEGTGSDLRTGLPRQMIELHEAMRLLVVVEQKPEVLTAVYEGQGALRELIGNAWVQLASINPDDGEISMFDPKRGFVRWTMTDSAVPVCGSSPEWYRDRAELLPPALIRPATEFSGDVSNA